MKYKVIGWTYYDNHAIEEGRNTWAARNAIVDEIKKHGYVFTGYDHQERDNCVPVLNDGRLRRFSQRGFGDIMAEAHGCTGSMDYSLFSFGFEDETQLVLPENTYTAEGRAPRTNLNERFKLSVTKEVFASAAGGAEIKLDDLPELRYLDEGDTLSLVCGEETADYTVTALDRRKDLTKKERLELELALCNTRNTARKRLAEEKLERAKIVLHVTLKECAHTCFTYLRFEPDPEGGTPITEDGRRMEELEKALRSVSADVVRKRFGLEVNRNAEYDVDVNVMIRRTIGCFAGREQWLKELCERYAVSVSLVVVPCIVADCAEPKPDLSPESDVIAFLYRTGASIDLDYYVC